MRMRDMQNTPGLLESIARAFSSRVMRPTKESRVSEAEKV